MPQKSNPPIVSSVVPSLPTAQAGWVTRARTRPGIRPEEGRAGRLQVNRVRMPQPPRRAATRLQRRPATGPCPGSGGPSTMPPKTSPDPAVPSVAGALALTMARPSGAAITVSVPLSTMMASLCRAAARVRVSLFLNTVIASASSRVGRAVPSIAGAWARVSSLTPSPGPISKP